MELSLALGWESGRPPDSPSGPSQDRLRGWATTLDPSGLPCQGVGEAGGSTQPLAQLSAQGSGKHTCFCTCCILSGTEDERADGEWKPQTLSHR